MKILAGAIAFAVSYLISGLAVVGMLAAIGGEVTGLVAVMLLLGWLVSAFVMTMAFYRWIMRLRGRERN